MQLDLRRLKEMHPRLPASLAVEYANCGGAALQRRGHQAGCDLAMSFHDGTPDLIASVDWERVPPGADLLRDRVRITEDGAEGVALAFVSVSQRWVVRRRMQRGEFADWLLEDRDRRLVALEVSGIDGMPDPRRVNEKLGQVARAIVKARLSACVVAFEPPAASLASL